MKKVLIFFIFLFSLSFSIFAEKIRNYEVEINLNQDSSLDIIEKIDYDFENQYRHGIFRYIPTKFEVEGQKNKNNVSKRKIKIENFQVYRDGQPENIADEYQDGENFVIKVGEPNRTINGLHKYILKYKVRGSIRYFNNFDEVYWNAIGTGWKVPIEKAEVGLNFQNGNFDKKSCYQGRLKSTEKCNIQGSIFKSTRVLNPGEGLTVAASFDKGLVKKEIFWDENILEIWWKEILAAVTALLSGISYWIYSYKNKFNPKRPIIPIFKPYKNYNPILTGYLIDQKLDPRDLTAGILHLAQKRYIKIEKIEKKILFFDTTDYIFHRLVEGEKINDRLELLMMEFLFSHQDIIELISKINSLNSLTVNEVENISSEMVESINLSGLSSHSHELFSKKKEIAEFLDDYAVSNAYIEKNQFLNKIIVPSIFMIFAGFGLTIVTNNQWWQFLIYLGFIVTFTAGFILNYRKTKTGWEVENNLKGFKMFLSYTEKERIEMLNSPAQNPQEFLEFLPYAVAFEVEDKWEKQFQSITIPQPDWFIGNTFVAANFMSEISNLNDSISSATTAASSSGSSGGGFSGGGGGGGGGGSW